jgi:PAS domain S-box-containing protein
MMATRIFFVPGELVPEPALRTSIDGVIEMCNAAFAAQFGVPPARLSGRRLESLVVELPAEVGEYLRACARSEQPLAGALTLQIGSGTSKYSVYGIADRSRRGSTSPAVALRLREVGERHDAPMNAGAPENAGIVRRAEIEESLRRERETLEVTLSSIGDGVIVTDAAGRVTFLNPVAERLTGWPLEEAKGLPFERIFRIVNEHSGHPVEHPVAKVLQSGGIVGLANHTVLIARDEQRIPIDDSGAPIRLPAGDLQGIVVVFRDVTERRRAEQARAWLAAIVESSDDAIVSKTLDGIVTSWNAAATRLFGYAPAEIIGKPITTIVPPDLHVQEAEILARLRRGERIDHFETARVAKDGRRIDVSLTVSPLRDASGAIVGASKTARDITEHKRTSEMLREADRRKDEFLATLAHELRNPLAPIRTAVELLRRGERLSPDMCAAVAILERQVRHMTHLVDDLLEVSRITSGRIHLNRGPVELTEVLETVMETHGQAAETARHEITFSAAGEPIYVDGDRIRLTQIFSNILHNAVKYTPSGGEIHVALRKEGGQAAISIRDSGVGIPRDMLERIFELFTQLDRSNERQDGLGIGLTLARKLTELHGGHIAATSAGPGQGSEFIIHLPADSARPAERDRVSSPDSERSVSRRVLIADDNHDAALSLSMLLQAMGHTTRIAHDGLEAVEQAEEFRPDVVLLDIGMPKLDGYGAARRIASLPWAGSTRIVAVTGWGQDADRQRAKEAGFHVHLVKPVDPKRLRQVIRGDIDQLSRPSEV